MMTDNISLDQLRVDNNFNLRSLYEASEHYDENLDSPFNQFDNECEYYEPDQFKSLTRDISKSKSYFHLNCRSLSSNWDAFKDLLCDVHCNDFSFDFIGISEIFKCDRDSRLVLPGYHSLISRYRDDDGRGGVGLLIKDSIQFHILTLMYSHLHCLS